MKDLLGNISFWIGLSLGLLVILDFFLRDKQRKWIASKAETFWLWLDEQKAGKFMNVLLYNKTYKLFVFMGNLYIVYLIVFRWKLDLSLESYNFFSILILILSMIVNTFYIHPFLLKKFQKSQSVKEYLTRCAFYIFIGYVSIAILIVIYDVLKTMFGDSLIFVVCAILVIIPIFVETYLFMTMLLFSLIWINIIFIIGFVFIVLKFVLLRISENPKGPVLALSGLLTGMGGIIKLFL